MLRAAGVAHSNRLAARGCRVVGLDNDPVTLDRARGEAGAMGTQPDYVEGDLRQLPFEDGRFDAVFNWRTSFGFFDEDGNRQQLREFARVLRSGGRLAMDLHSRDDLIRRMPARGPLLSVGERDDNFLIERTRFDPLAGRSKTERIVVRDGRVRRFRFSLATPTASRSGMSPSRSCLVRGTGFARARRCSPRRWRCNSGRAFR